jgi:hypothetical protein
MRATRRNVLKGAALAAAATSVEMVAAPLREPASVLVYDSRFPASRAFAAQHSDVTRIDIAQEEERLWASFRAAPAHGRIIGLTRWSDWVMARGWLEEHGRRVGVEQAQGAMFRWEMH